MKYGICGIAFSGNKGAEGMLLALIQHLSILDKDAVFHVMSYYPGSDRRAGHETGSIKIINGSPKRVIGYFFQSLWCIFCRALHLPAKFYLHGDFAMIADCDIFLDAAGISFSDGREKFTVFNILSLLPALASGVKTVKISQAMGPFKNKINRMLAKIVLPKLALIVSRGEQTGRFLSELQLTNTTAYPDAAFSMECSEADTIAAAALLPDTGGKKIIGISPSQVVWNLCSKQNVDYTGILADITAECRNKGFHCVVFPHSARTGTDKTHNNDLPIIKKFASALPPGNDLTVLDKELEAGVLRCLIAKMDILIASRFHAIISAMSAGVPAVVVGWSHKYAEVLAPFQLDDFVQSYSNFSKDATMKMIEELSAERQKFSEKIQKESRIIKEKNLQFFQDIIDLASKE